MIPNGLFTQIALIILSGGIIFTYIRPLLTEVSASQEQIVVYRVERDKVLQVNEQLQRLKTKTDTVSAMDNQKLSLYLPNTIDVIAVPRDIQAITELAGVILKNVSYEGPLQEQGIESTESTVVNPVAHTFSLSVEGNYNQIKELLTYLEQNAYPLEVHKLNIKKIDGGFLSADMSLVTYERKLPDVIEIVN
jgi:hypothetical protein